jgi:hypothetical protein
MKNFLRLATAASLVSASVLGGIAMRSADAATITWGAATTIVGDTDVDTVGTLFQAANFAGNTSTVNGVQFDAFTGNTNGNISVNYGQEFATNFGSGQDPFFSLSSDYKELLRSGGIFATNVTISGLSNGTEYSIQYWANDSRTQGATRTMLVGGVTLDLNDTDADGGVGQWVSGTFTADGSTQSFTLAEGTNHTYSNAMQVRVVPEPSTLAGLGIIGAGLAAVIRRRLRAAKSVN